MPQKFGLWKLATQQQHLKSFGVRQGFSAANLKEAAGQNAVEGSLLVQITATYELGGTGGSAEVTYTINGDGAILVSTELTGISAALPNIPRLGNKLILKDQYLNVHWYGRGPHENYQDRNTGAFVARYEAKVSELMYPYIRPQENGYRTDVRRVACLDATGNGIAFSTTGELLSFSAHHQLNSDFDEGEKKIQRHTFDVPHRNIVNVNIDYKQMGVGGDDSWGARPHEEYMDFHLLINCREAIINTCKPKQLSCVDPSAEFLAKAEERHLQNTSFFIGSASKIPVADASFDIVVSGLALNFFPGLTDAFSEMKRVLKPSGTIAAYVWDYSGKMEFLRFFWDTAREIDTAAFQLDEGNRFPICNAEILQQAFLNAGLSNVESLYLDIDTVFKDFHDYWDPFLGGQGPAPSYLASLSEGNRKKLYSAIHKKLPAEQDGSIKLIARAIAVQGKLN